MTIDSGLEELVVMKDRQVLDIGCLDHTLGVAELEWMTEHWPRVRILGLFLNFNKDLAPVLWSGSGRINLRGSRCRRR